MRCFTSPPTQYRLYGRRFLQVKRPNQQYQSTEGTNSTQTNQTYNKQTWTQNTASPVVYNMGRLGGVDQIKPFNCSEGLAGQVVKLMLCSEIAEHHIHIHNLLYRVEQGWMSYSTYFKSQGDKLPFWQHSSSRRLSSAYCSSPQNLSPYMALRHILREWRDPALRIW